MKRYICFLCREPILDGLWCNHCGAVQSSNTHLRVDDIKNIHFRKWIVDFKDGVKEYDAVEYKGAIYIPADGRFLIIESPKGHKTFDVKKNKTFDVKKNKGVTRWRWG